MLIYEPDKKKRLTFWALVALAALLVTWTVLRFVSPSPPRTLKMSTGAVDGAYHQFGLKYQAILKQNGVTLELTPSTGSVQNLQRLNDRSADVSFVQGGLGLLALDPSKDEADTDLRTLATVAYEPVWLFTRNLDLSRGIANLRGKRVAIGPPNSGNSKVALDLLTTYGLVDVTGRMVGETELRYEGGLGAAEQLQKGALDALFLVASPQAASVALLLNDTSIDLASLDHVDGLATRLPYFQTVHLRPGSVNPLRNIPPNDIAMIATKANLVIPEDLHPALAYLLLEAARQTHSRPSLFSRPGDFPSPVGTDFPLADEGDRFFKSGRPFLQRYLPFWIANLVQRLAVVLLPLAALMVPLFTVLPALLGWKQKNRLYLRYGDLKRLENELIATPPESVNWAAAKDRLNTIERDIIATPFPLDYADRAFTLRQHVDYVRARLATLQPETGQTLKK